MNRHAMSRLHFEVIRRQFCVNASRSTAHSRTNLSIERQLASNPGVNVEQFKALFRPVEGKLRHPRYKLRWDWHLRNFLTALIPPAAMLLFYKIVALFGDSGLELYDARFEGVDPVTGEIRTLESRATANLPTEISSREELITLLVKPMQDRLHQLEDEIKRLKARSAQQEQDEAKAQFSDRVERARELSSYNFV